MKSNERKQGEKEAMLILKAKGISFNENYSDDGQKGHSIPDLQYSDGRYIEVTHTLHNNNLAKPILRQYTKKPLKEQYEIAKEAGEALERLQRFDYPTEFVTVMKLTKEGAEQYARDKKIVKKHFGRIDGRTGRSSEFDCDMPIIECSYENIVREIIEKGEKHTDGTTDLFIFVLEAEYESMMDLIKSRSYNGNYNYFMNAVWNSPFQAVYICVWNFESQRYEIEKPLLMKLWKDSQLHYSQI